MVVYNVLEKCCDCFKPWSEWAFRLFLSVMMSFLIHYTFCLADGELKVWVWLHWERLRQITCLWLPVEWAVSLYLSFSRFLFPLNLLRWHRNLDRLTAHHPQCLTWHFLYVKGQTEDHNIIPYVDYIHSNDYFYIYIYIYIYIYMGVMIHGV